MTRPDRDPVRELIEQARELRHREQPPPELFEAALGRLLREGLGPKELARGRSRELSLSHALNAVRSALVQLGPARLGLALALALAVIVSWRARRQQALDPHQDVPTVALVAEPTPVHDATRAPALGDHGKAASAQQRPAFPAAPSPAPKPPLSEPPRRAEKQVGAASSHEPSSGVRRLHLSGSPVAIDRFYSGAPPASILWLDDAAAARIESSGDQRKVAGFWAVESWIQELSPRRPALRQLPDHRQCIDVHGGLVLGSRSRGEPGRQGFELARGQRYRIILPRVSVAGPAPLELIVMVGSADGDRDPALVTHVISTATPSTVGFTFEPRHDDARAGVFLFVDTVAPSEASQLCLGPVRLDPLRTDAGTGAEPASSDKTAGAKKAGKKKAAPKGSPEKPTDKPAEPRSCDPPWYIDAKGIKHLKPTCL